MNISEILKKWMIIDNACRNGYSRENINIGYDGQMPVLPEEITKLRDEIYRELHRQGSQIRVWNGQRYCLKGFFITRDPIAEEPILHLKFGPTDYFNFLATSMNLDKEIKINGIKTTLRKRYLENVDPWAKPIDFLAHSFGINLAVITADNRLILTKRSGHVRSRPLSWNTTISEGLQRPVDSDKDGRPDLYKAAARGIREELGIIVPEEQIKFLSFGLDTELYQYGILGCVKLNVSFKNIKKAAAIGSSDSWEGSICAIPFTVQDVACFMNSNGPWVPAGIVCIIHTLIYSTGISAQEIVESFKRIA